ncbi:RloB domain-containing protein [Pseudoflavonifractor phocaeensis]|uniref:RloB family protein n=1 Tax=Pseudoflavonifractor phocaeensis TaxID=1870988 RepID=UPI0019589AED|nr:RloB family protein [Pseudoflavonifractor phocaeensis]MBM6937076.1 RloB domain-containing protein [Pseudoflavonifractor phocaeensis]
MARGKIEKRGQRRRKIKPVILIVTEGSQTEPKYFEHYRSRQTNIDIRVIGSRTSGGETDYLSLIRKAVEYQNKNQISVSSGDAVWVLADGDVNYNNPDPIKAKDSLLIKARKLAESKGIHMALSNPCFEFWYLLHFQFTTKFFKDYPAVKNALAAYLPDYEKSGDVYGRLSEHTAAAIQNAKHVEQYHLQDGCNKPFGIAVNPFTDIYHLVESLL